MLNVQNLSKQYNQSNWALKDVHFELSAGIVGLIGENGAGKSTLMRILATLSLPTEGDVIWSEHSIRQKPHYIRHDLGYLPQTFGFYPNLTANEYLTYLAIAKKIPKKGRQNLIEEALEQVNLSHHQHERLSTFSGGMIQRVGIAQAIMNSPKLLILDEPMVGLDPAERQQFKSILTSLSHHSLIIFSSHIINDVESIAHDVLLLNRGLLLAHLTPQALIKKVEGCVYESIIPEKEIEAFKQSHQLISEQTTANGMRCRYYSTSKQSGQSIAVTATLEDAYLYIYRQSQYKART